MSLQTHSKQTLFTVIALAAGLWSMSAAAGLINTDGNVSFVKFNGSDGGFGTATAGTDPTSVSLTTYNTGTPGTVDLGDGKSIVFTEAGGGTPVLKDNTMSGATWWPTSGSFVGTNTTTINLDFIGMNVVALKLLVAVSYDLATGWLGAHTSDGDYSQSKDFPLRRIDRAQQYGMFLTASAQRSCTTINRAVIDPNPKWGIAGIMVYESADPECTEVPEPGTMSLLGAGLLALGLIWRQRNRMALQPV
ncbi:MAG: PEP-CTERM sorting domain-containing protein [Pseudomonadales bacterium]